MTITLNIPPDLDGPLQRAARMQGKDVAAFLLDSARQQLRHDVLPKYDVDLLQIINAPVAPEARMKRDALVAEQAQRELTIEERDTLADLINAVELANAARWQSIAELAHRRGQSLAEIAQDLQIPLS